ncbi:MULTISPECIES: 50S ribosomal protein L11 methyltransferase [Trichocoleus]|uniref:50S ribosomal protein L11 methyltransferase n=1 Tax=Trichocoleus desertorum GB2-A4 TaxID=2933944 RepID=A0ABV0JAN9_9CYAN|nr:50S ribosomal protein L11 methyltransferase [Trichocoleus sp. FACHB-46]MBD1863089.1 50S ribosomal protein L11 methyltransferase [Trichocoleus sp. FACHB-46]
MSWIELSLDTTPEAVDWVQTLLAGTDYQGEIRVTAYSELDSRCPREPETPPHDWAFTICLYLPYDIRVRTQIAEIDSVLSPLHRTGLTTELQASIVEEKPALPETVSSLVHRIGQRFVVLPGDIPYQPETANELTLRIQTSLAFGSGFHPATRLSLRLLERHVRPEMRALDLGSGSGILSVAIAKLGAQVLALDNDRVAVESTQDAVERNGVAQQVRVMEGSLGGGSELGHWMGGDISDQVPTVKAIAEFDLIMANILARVHVALADDYRQALRQNQAQDARLITAGFTTDHEAEVTAALAAAGFTIIDSECCNEWVALAYQLQA